MRGMLFCNARPTAVGEPAATGQRTAIAPSAQSRL
jgi:hypothetical protein